MFSPEFMSYLIMYQSNEFESEKVKYIELKNDENTFGIHRFTKYATVPVKVER